MVGAYQIVKLRAIIGGNWKAFEKYSNDLFLPQNLGQHVMMEYRYRKIYQCWKFSEEESRPPEYDDNVYWKTDILLHHFNYHYKKFIHHH